MNLDGEDSKEEYDESLDQESPKLKTSKSKKGKQYKSKSEKSKEKSFSIHQLEMDVLQILNEQN